MSNMLYDKDFLLKLDASKNKTIYARITALQFDEAPIETIEGRVTAGSINIDGTSAVRRTCSLTIVAQDFNYNEYYWGLKTKFKLEVGVQNYVDSTMPDIIWFDEGIYLITSFNTSRTTNNFTISINGKDKMCLLNGEVGGSLESSVDFGTIEEEDINGVWTIRSIPIPEIIRNAVHTYAGEPYWNIVINDLDTYGLELLEYRYDTPMYFYRSYIKGADTGIFHNMLMENDDLVVYPAIGESLDNYTYGESCRLKDLTSDNLDLLVDSLTNESHEALPVKVGNKEYIFAKVEYGQTAGYRTTDLTYPGDLIANVGESITSILDKIKNMLTEFEYFYDLDGRFIFQKKKSFISTMWSPVSTDEEGNAAVTESLMTSTATAYTFSGSSLITAFNNNPNLLNMRNDYSIWGERTGVSGAAIPVHMRYAIDRKPEKYTQIYVDNDDPQIEAYNTLHGTTLKGNEDPQTFEASGSDWREVIYQMALDYYKYNILDDFEIRLIEANPQYPTGQTGYERYYIDLQGFWRQLYYPGLDDKIEETKTNVTTTQTTVNDLKGHITTLENQLSAASANNDYATVYQLRDEIASAKKALNIAEVELEDYLRALKNYQTEIQNYYYDSISEHLYWNRDVYERPEVLNFWFDFLDSEGELQQFSVKNVGSRSKAINDTAIKSIYFRETPAVVFTDDITQEKQVVGTGYRYIQIPNDQIDSMFSISGQGKSAKDKLDELIYQHGYCVESATITAIPIYYLEPNVRVYLHDEDTGLDGDYVISKITLPLAYNGTMSLTATKAAQSIL